MGRRVRRPPSNGTHFAFIALSQEAVRAFHAAALATGGTDDGAAGPRPDRMAPTYYCCFVRDSDGHKLEAAVIPQMDG